MGLWGRKLRGWETSTKLLLRGILGSRLLVTSRILLLLAVGVLLLLLLELVVVTLGTSESGEVVVAVLLVVLLLEHVVELVGHLLALRSQSEY